MENKVKTLVLVEGAKTDVNLMKKLFDIYHISDNHEIISYNTNIYTLYKEMFENKDPSTIDLLQLLKEKEFDTDKRKILDVNYSDIILIFDFDPQDNLFTSNKIVEMLEYFKESSDMGKLYINYPMVESFYHMKSIPDFEFFDYVVKIEELTNYKSIVNKICRDGDYRKFARTKDEVDIVIKDNLKKSKKIINNSCYNDITLLKKQCEKLANEYEIYVICTCHFYILDYNPKLVSLY